jgi:hypothetical protein
MSDGNNRALIAAVGIGLGTLLLTQNVNNETDYMNAIYTNQAIVNSEDFQKVYKEKIDECANIDIVKNFDNISKRKDCELKIMSETIEEFKGRSPKIK